jgi:hypothetical protein
MRRVQARPSDPLFSLGRMRVHIIVAAEILPAPEVWMAGIRVSYLQVDGYLHRLPTHNCLNKSEYPAV